MKINLMIVKIISEDGTIKGSNLKNFRQNFFELIFEKIEHLVSKTPVPSPKRHFLHEKVRAAGCLL